MTPFANKLQQNEESTPCSRPGTGVALAGSYGSVPKPSEDWAVIWVLLEGLGFKCFFSRFPVIQGWGMSDNMSIEYMQPMFQPKSWFSDFAICATNDGSLSLSPYPENSSFPFLNPGPINMLNTCSRVPCPQGDIGHFEAYVMRPMT